MFYRKCLEKVGYYDSNIYLWEDWDFRIRFSKIYNYAYCDNINMVYRKHSLGISQSNEYLHYHYQKKIYYKNRHLLNDISDEDKRFINNRVDKKLSALLVIILQNSIQNQDWIKMFYTWIRLYFLYRLKKYIIIFLKTKLY